MPHVRSHLRRHYSSQVRFVILRRAFQFHIDELLFILLFLLCIMLSFICITSSPSIFMLLSFFFPPSLVFPPSPVQTDKKISIEHASHRKFTFP